MWKNKEGQREKEEYRERERGMEGRERRVGVEEHSNCGDSQLTKILGEHFSVERSTHQDEL